MTINCRSRMNVRMLSADIYHFICSKQDATASYKQPSSTVFSRILKVSKNIDKGHRNVHNVKHSHFCDFFGQPLEICSMLALRKQDMLTVDSAPSNMNKTSQHKFASILTCLTVQQEATHIKQNTSTTWKSGLGPRLRS